ncbi:hypothetical protein, partial [Desulfitobacterium sp.]|uniref:hypothetical protein n=1 Tax=Desulfitobacterium sp. TaxID=49981 RepID=UPI002D16EB04
PHYQSLMDHYRMETASNNVLVRLRQAKQMSMDERKNIGVELTANQVQLVSVDPGTRQLTSLEEPFTFDPRLAFDSASSIGLLTNLSEQQYLFFDYRGFLQTNPAGSAGTIAIKGNQTSQLVMVNIEAGTANMVISWP